MRQFASWLLTDEGMVTVLLRTSIIFLHVLKAGNLLIKALESGGNWIFCRVESQGWLNETLKNHTSLSEDCQVSGLSDIGFVSLPELAGGDGDLGEKTSGRV